MKIIDGKNTILGKLSAYAAKEALKGEEVVIVNCGEVIITGNKKNIKENFEAKRKRVGSTQKGPKVSLTSEKIVKTAIRGMLPNYRTGRGKIAFKKIKCYSNIPKEYEKEKLIEISKKRDQTKKIELKDITKW